MENAYGLDADYFNRLFARELKPDIVRNQTPTCLARVLLRAARTASEQVFAELEFSGLFPKPAEALAGITLSAEGEANTYRMMRGGNWLASIRMNGELLVSQQEAILSAMLASPPADHSAHGLNMVGALATALDGLLSITQDSAGVAGYHLNGEIAEWAEFPEVDTAHDVLSLYHERAAKPSFFGIDLAQGALDAGPWRDAIIAQGWTPPVEPAADLHVWRATTKFGSTCHFGEASAAKAWAGPDGKIERVDLKPVPDLQVVEQPDTARANIDDSDLVLVPRGLLGAAAYAVRERCEAPNVLARLREYGMSVTPKTSEARELLAHALRKSFPLFDDAELDQFIHCCEHSILQDRKRLHAILDGAVPQSIEKVGVLRDAMRYRWLRDSASSPAGVIDKRGDFVARDEFGGGGYYNYEYRAGEELDAAIDAALSGAQEGGE